MVSVPLPMPRISAPALRRKPARSAISGSLAAFSSTTVPRQPIAASIAFSVAPTLGNGNVMRAGRDFFIRQVIFPASSAVSAPSASSAIRCRSIGRAPSGHPPGSATAACPVRAVSAPRKMTDERIFLASSGGTSHAYRPRGSTNMVLPCRSTRQPSRRRIESAVETSSICGQLCNTHGLWQRTAAAKMGKTLFFAP